MPQAAELFLGEWLRSLDDRYRLSLPPDWAATLAAGADECTMAKERPGCLSLWNSRSWHSWLDEGVELLRTKLRSGRLDERTESVQMVGRLLSTRHHATPIAGRGRIVIPENFRSFLGVEPGGEVLVVGAVLCVEVWRPQSWSEHIGEHMPGFRRLFNELTE